MTIASQQTSGGIGKYFAIYVAILLIAALQFLVAYENVDGSQILFRLLSLAVIEAGLAVMFFMHLWTERRSFVVFVGVFTLFVLAALQFSWSDSFRILLCGSNCS